MQDNEGQSSVRGERTEYNFSEKQNNSQKDNNSVYGGGDSDSDEDKEIKEYHRLLNENYTNDAKSVVSRHSFENLPVQNDYDD